MTQRITAILILANYSRFLRLQPMKRNLLVAASLLGAVASFSITRAEASPQFSVTAASPGAIQFAGSGTAQFNNSIGTNNSFQVGSSTNLGVNASTSSTPSTEFSTESCAWGASLKQVLGTSGGDVRGQISAPSQQQSVAAPTPPEVCPTGLHQPPTRQT